MQMTARVTLAAPPSLSTAGRREPPLDQTCLQPLRSVHKKTLSGPWTGAGGRVAVWQIIGWLIQITAARRQMKKVGHRMINRPVVYLRSIILGTASELLKEAAIE